MNCTLYNIPKIKVKPYKKTTEGQKRDIEPEVIGRGGGDDSKKMVGRQYRFVYVVESGSLFFEDINPKPQPYFSHSDHIDLGEDQDPSLI